MAQGYDHTQRGILHYVVGLPGGAFVFLALLLGEGSPLFICLVALATLVLFLGGCFGYLHVRDSGDALSIRFGPVQVFGTSIRYSDIARAEVARTNLLHGWGIHGFPGLSVTYNIHGFDCVRVVFKKPRGLFRFRRINIGSDDAAGLAAFLSFRIASAP